MRFVTYNIRHGQGIDGWVSNRRVARALERARADVIGLNEVWHIAGMWDQPAEIARELEMDHAFGANHVRWVHSMGNAVMSCESLVSVDNLPLPGGFERRGALAATVQLDGAEALFVCVHLSLGKKPRSAQIAWLAENLPRDQPLVLAGDFNCLVPELEPLREVLTVVDDPPASFPSVWPTKALDHIAYSSHWTLADRGVVPSLASDHVPVWADLRLK